MFLQSVPILPDFDSEKDKPLLQKYINKFQNNEGIELERHRLVFVAIKI